MKSSLFGILAVPSSVVGKQLLIVGRKEPGQVVRAKFLSKPPLDETSKISPDQDADPVSWSTGSPDQELWAVRLSSLAKGAYRVELQLDDDTRHEFAFESTAAPEVAGVDIQYPVSGTIDGESIIAYGESDNHITTNLAKTYIKVNGVKYNQAATIIVDSDPDNPNWAIQFTDVPAGDAVLRVENTDGDSDESEFEVS